MSTSVPRGAEQVRGLQERVARALPAEHVERLDGWWLRHTATSSWWRGTVLPHGEAGPDELVRLISAAERYYAEFGAAATFQVSPGVCPAGLDATLAGRGYRRAGSMSLRTSPTCDVRARPRPENVRIRLSEQPTTAWFDVWYALHGDGTDPRIEFDALERVRQPSAFACALRGNQIVAVGRAVADTGWAGVFGMATLPEARGGGAARGVLASLADWADTHGADGMYLQVGRDNHPALRLYDRAGFTALCDYHYRSGSPPTA